MLRATAGFLLVAGVLGLLFNGMFWLLGWAEDHSAKDEEVEKAWAETYEEGETDFHENFYRKLLPLWAVLFVIGGLASLVLILMD